MSAPHVVRIDSPAGLIDAIPHMMGFHPDDSLILMCMIERNGRTISGPLMRVDLPTTDDDDELAPWVLQVIQSVPVRQVEIVSINMITVGDSLPVKVWEYLPTGLGMMLNLPPRERLHTTSTRPGATFVCMCPTPGCAHAGVVPDVTSEIQTVVTTLGHVTHLSREEAAAAGKEFSHVLPPEPTR